MRLDLRNVINTPDAKQSFQFEVDMSDLDFYGRTPITRPVQAEGCVTNHAGALVLEGTARSVLDLTCERIFPRKDRPSGLSGGSRAGRRGA